MTNGIYCYIDKKTNKVVYVGKDSYIDKNERHKQHYQKSRYNRQPINRILQNNPGRYQYKVLKESNFSENLLKALEIIYIQRYNTFRPKTNHGWNFSMGGDGILGYKHSQEARKKMSEAQKGENNPMYGKTGENHPMFRKKHSQETKKKMSEVRNTSGYFRVSKHKDKKCKQGFRWRYWYRENGKRKSISSIDIKKLEKKVKAQGLIWGKI